MVFKMRIIVSRAVIIVIVPYGDTEQVDQLNSDQCDNILETGDYNCIFKK